MAEMAAGMACRFSSRRRAVTITSPRIPPPPASVRAFGSATSCAAIEAADSHADAAASMSLRRTATPFYLSLSGYAISERILRGDPGRGKPLLLGDEYSRFCARGSDVSAALRISRD